MKVKVLQGFVEHSVKVTYLGKGLYGCRVYVNGELNGEEVVYGREAIGPACRRLLRMEAKCGNLSNFADRARFRIGEKQLTHRNVKNEY